MIDKMRKLRKQTVFATTPNVDYYKPVVSNLSITPSEVERLSERGIPVSSANVGSFIDGVQNPSFSLPVDRLRGVDVVDVWNESESSRKKFRNAAIKDVKENANT